MTSEISDERSARRGWVLPLLLLIAASALYARIALGPALPLVIPALLERSVATESELTRAFRAMIAALSFAMPPLILLAVASITWGVARLSGIRPGFSRVLTIVGRASLFATAGLLVKALLVAATDSPDPPVNLGFFFPQRTPIRAGLIALTNPFVIGAAIAAARGLTSLGLSGSRAALAGAGPWVLGAVLFAQASAGGGIVPDLTSVTDGWASVRGASIEVRFPQALVSEAEPLARALDAFASGLQSKLDAPSRPIVVDVFPTHAALERATREQIPVEVTGSIRGRDLLYLEMPGRSAAVPRPRALEDAARYVALLVLAPLAGDSPRWFVEGIAHAEAVPYSPTIDRRYLETLQEHGIPTFDALANPGLFRTPEGPLLARALVDHLAAHHGGREVIDGILRDAIGGKPFRDALYERARLTLTALETSWQDSVRAILAEAASGESR